MLIVAIILLVIGLGALLVAGFYQFEDKSGKTITRGIGVVAILIALVVGAGSSFYTQDAGEAKVKIDATGNITGQTTETGLHLKFPWESTKTFNIRNQPATFVGNGSTDNSGSVPDGAQITVGDSSGVQSNVDITVRYSIDPSAVTKIYTAYSNEESFKASFIKPDVRSVVRDVMGSYTVIEAYATDREAVSAAIEEALTSKWEKSGVRVDSISLQEVRPPETVLTKFADQQAAQTNVDVETANLAAETVKAQQKVVTAQAEADANAILAASLTDPILKQRYLDTLKELAAGGNVIVVPEGFSGIVNTAK